MSTSPRTANPVKKHRREVRMRIIAPVALPLAALVVVCVLLAIGVAAGTLVSSQVTVVMGLVATLFIAFPLTILCLVPYLLLALTAHGAGLLHAHATGPLRGVRRATAQIAQKTDQHVPRLARPLIGLNARIARWEHVVKSLQSPPPAEEFEDD